MSHLLASTAIAALQLQLEAAQKLLPLDYPFGDPNALLNTPSIIYGARIRGLDSNARSIASLSCAHAAMMHTGLVLLDMRFVDTFGGAQQLAGFCDR